MIKKDGTRVAKVCAGWRQKRGLHELGKTSIWPSAANSLVVFALCFVQRRGLSSWGCVGPAANLGKSVGGQLLSVRYWLRWGAFPGLIVRHRGSLEHTNPAHIGQNGRFASRWRCRH